MLFTRHDDLRGSPEGKFCGGDPGPVGRGLAVSPPLIGAIMAPWSQQPFPSFLPAGQAPMGGTRRTPNSLERGVTVSSVDAAPSERVGIKPKGVRDKDLGARTSRGSTIRVITLLF